MNAPHEIYLLVVGTSTKHYIDKYTIHSRHPPPNGYTNTYGLHCSQRIQSPQNKTALPPIPTRKLPFFPQNDGGPNGRGFAITVLWLPLSTWPGFARRFFPKRQTSLRDGVTSCFACLFSTQNSDPPRETQNIDTNTRPFGPSNRYIFPPPPRMARYLLYPPHTRGFPSHTAIPPRGEAAAEQSRSNSAPSRGWVAPLIAATVVVAFFRRSWKPSFSVCSRKRPLSRLCLLPLAPVNKGAAADEDTGAFGAVDDEVEIAGPYSTCTQAWHHPRRKPKRTSLLLASRFWLTEAITSPTPGRGWFYTTCQSSVYARWPPLCLLVVGRTRGNQSMRVPMEGLEIRPTHASHSRSGVGTIHQTRLRSAPLRPAPPFPHALPTLLRFAHPLTSLDLLGLPSHAQERKTQRAGTAAVRLEAAHSTRESIHECTVGNGGKACIGALNTDSTKACLPTTQDRLPKRRTPEKIKC